MCVYTCAGGGASTPTLSTHPAVPPSHLQPLANDRLGVVFPDLEVRRAFGRRGQRRHDDLRPARAGGRQPDVGDVVALAAMTAAAATWKCGEVWGCVKGRCVKGTEGDGRLKGSVECPLKCGEV